MASSSNNADATGELYAFGVLMNLIVSTLENNNLRHKSNHKSNRFGPPKIEQKDAGEGLAKRTGDVTKVYYLLGRMRKNLIYHDTLSTKSDFQNNPKICATICATSVTAYWWVPGMFFGDKRVIGLPKSNTNDHAFDSHVIRNTVCHLPIFFGNQTII